MHTIFRESHGLDRADTPHDPGQAPADLVVLPFSDSDLGAFAAGWHRTQSLVRTAGAVRDRTQDWGDGGWCPK